MRTSLLAVAVALVLVSPWITLSAQEGSITAQKGSETSAVAPEWLLGQWIFDEEYTKKKQAEPKKEPNLADVAGALVTSQLMTQLQGSKLMFNKQEFTMTTKDGNGKSMRYTVLKAPDENTALLKEDNGDVTGFHRDGDHIWMTSTGSVNEPFYFKRAQ
ncbi:hypothetical protein ACXR0O_12700 [Verrucomicrobiota bacterium sgz303538]